MTESLPPEDRRDALIREQAALIAGLSSQVTDLSAQIAELTALVRELREVPRVPGAVKKQKPGRMLLECLPDRESDVLRFHRRQARHQRPGRPRDALAGNA